jgi:hypothetical protein
MSDAIRELADYVSLLYHEARNVRHLIRANHISADGWEKIVNLPTNRDEAWRAIQPVRNEARKAESASTCLAAFEQRFDVDLEGLQLLFENPNWRHAGLYGGNAWAQIAASVSQLAHAVQSGEVSDQDVAMSALRSARHNTGTVDAKLQSLDANPA